MMKRMVVTMKMARIMARRRQSNWGTHLYYLPAVYNYKLIIFDDFYFTCF